MSTVLTHAGLLHDYPKSELRAVWETAAPKLGLSPTAIKYIRRLIELTSKQDYLPNSICTVFYGVAKLTQKIGMPRRSINRAEAELAEAGWIVMSCPKRGRRNGARSVDGGKQIRWAAGVNLGPLVDRFPELQELATEIEIDTLTLQACRAEINATRRQIIEAGFENDAVKAYPRGRPSEITSLDKLNRVLATLKQVMETVLDCPRRPECPAGSAKTVRPNTIHKSKYIDSTAQKGENLDAEPLDLTALDRVATEQMKEAIETYAGYNDPLSALSMACRDRCADMGIPDERWRLTERKFGVGVAALFITVIDRNFQRPEGDPYRVREPQRCLSGMAWKHAKRQLNLAGMIAEIKKSSPHPRCQDEGSKVTLVATPPHLVREGMLRSFPSTPTKPRNDSIPENHGGQHV